VNTLQYASAMENSIGVTLRTLQANCSPELTRVLEHLVQIQRELERVVLQAESVELGQGLPKFDVMQIIGDEVLWRSLANPFQPSSLPSAIDYTVLWSVHAMMAKSAQYYQQAAMNTDQPNLRIDLSSIAEMKLILQRRVAAIERIVANQLWQSLGFPPGLLAKE
jgi:hypothetical protein